MMILQIIHNHKFGGAEQHLRDLCEGLRDAGHVVEVAAPLNSWIGQRLIEAGFVVHDFDFRGHYDVLAMARLFLLLRQKKFDIVHAHLVRAAWYGRIAAALSGTPMLSSVHDMTTWKRYSRKHSTIAVSMAVKKHLISRGFEADKIFVVFPGAKNCDLGEVAEQTRQKVRKDLGLTDLDIAVFMIGRVAEVKGHDIALDAMRLLSNSDGGRVRLFCAGQETEWGRALHASDAGQYATWLGRRDDVAELLAAADIFIQPSRSEGLGIAIMEAASASKPIIATSVGGIPEIIDDQVNGLLVPPESSFSLAEAIKKMARDADEANFFGRVAQHRFEIEYSIPIMIQKTVAIYRSVIAESV
ncbi:MAG: glycosyltransferase family 4 protein [Aquabacterium sp.]|uniref:glycosyltransferase family 4 protein n=1 Tax=Aquabacterium sp. TaxID=1872578 RepID=UPI002A36DE78|nr:glycosyltransferase family 4 protein [Aquabacterium sp.]MDX9844572.1 glycosyltransferase family 4 protein [Aquabacterium sp.]